jgi:putative chitinase
MTLTLAQLATVMPHADERADRYLEPLVATMAEYDIDTPARVAMWLAQIAHESAELRLVTEIADGTQYEGRADLGNTTRGDGRRYRGRGLIQITGRANYAACSRALAGADMLLLEHPQLLADDPLLAARSAGWYWRSRDLNGYADRGDITGCTRVINGGRNGLPDRIRYWDRARAVLGLDLTTTRSA